VAIGPQHLEHLLFASLERGFYQERLRYGVEKKIWAQQPPRQVYRALQLFDWEKEHEREIVRAREIGHAEER
jgi:hypothetical protein